VFTKYKNGGFRMKLGKSVVFLFFGFFLSAFFYALLKTENNGFRSFQFVVYYTIIKIGLISLSPNVVLKFNQPNQQIISISIIQPNPYISVFEDYQPSGLYMNNIERSVPKNYYLSHYS
jgi:hypothetical protein